MHVHVYILIYLHREDSSHTRSTHRSGFFELESLQCAGGTGLAGNQTAFIFNIYLHIFTNVNVYMFM
jgi:hypothetical protein